MLKSLFSQLKNKLGNDQQEQLEEKPHEDPITTLTSDKIKAIVAELTSSNQIFEEAGFIMEQLEIEVGLTSRITPRFKQIKTITAEEESQLLERISHQKMISFVLISLFKSSRMKSLLQDTNMIFHGIEIEIATAPSVKTIFKREQLNPDLIEETRH